MKYKVKFKNTHVNIKANSPTDALRLILKEGIKQQQITEICPVKSK